MEKQNSQIIEKFDIKLKTRPKDGIILQLHHTIRESNGESRRIRFSAGIFNDTQEKLACADTAGNVLILDFIQLKFWKLSGIGACSALYFAPNKEDLLVVGSAKNNDINFMDIETGKFTLNLKGHSAPVKCISFANNKNNNLLTASSVEAILWEQRNYTKYFTLNTYLGAQIQHIMFSPAGEYLVACFQNDTVQIWKHDSMKSVKQIIPSELKHLKSIAFTMNGRAMAIAGLTPTLILFNMDTWKALKSIDLTKYKFSGAQQISFIPQMFDGGSNKILAILGNDCALYLLDLESLAIIHTIKSEQSGIRRFAVSSSGKYFITILQQGEVNIYNSSFVMDLAQQTSISESTHIRDPCSSHKQMVAKTQLSKKHSKVEIQKKMRLCMDSARLRRILMQYGEYPDKFRSIIWRSLLDTPRNKTAYGSLIDKGIHPAYKDIEKQFTIHSSSTLKNLKRLLSCLAHWCPLFGVMKFLPAFVFPFVKVLQRDPLLLFECVASVLTNYCQLWFEYAPFPPISVLAMVENILGEHDKQLLDHYCAIGVTSQTYALKILETAFSEVLNCSEWLILWDHILSNEPSFILMAVVSYNMVQKNAIKKLKTREQLDKFFHMQNPIDKKTFLKKTYLLVNETSKDIHPRRFFSKFAPLDNGDCYQQFTGYPKATICLKLAKSEKKKSRSERTTLKDLTTKSQEKFVYDRYKNGSTTEGKIASEESYQDLDEDSKKPHSKADRKSSKDTGKEKGDFNVKKSQHISNINPSPSHVVKNLFDGNMKIECEHSPKTSKSRKKIADQVNKNLEKEVVKMLTNCTNSDASE